MRFYLAQSPKRVFVTYLQNNTVALTVQKINGPILTQLFDRSSNTFSNYHRIEGNYSLDDVVADANGNLTYFFRGVNNGIA